MATAIIDGISTRYETLGSGPPLLMFSPGGFDATLDKWTTQSIYAKIRILDHLAKKYTCIVFDRRETGQSGGRVEAITWKHYADQGVGLLQHLGIPRAHVMGGCMGCSVAAAFAVEYPEASASLLLWWPVGGARYRMNGHRRFNEHLAFVAEQRLPAVAALAKSGSKSFGEDPRGGPWVSVLRRDESFAASYVTMNVDDYMQTTARMRDALIDRDTAPGAEPEDLMKLDVPALIVPGRDATHATSAARYLEECLPRSQYWDVPVEQQSEQNAAPRLIDFLDSVSGG